MGFIKFVKSLFHRQDACISCGQRISGMIQSEGVYRKKCPKCGTVNYRVKVYSGDHNNYTLKLGTKEEYEKEKKQWDIYNRDIYPRVLLKKEFGEGIVELATKRAGEKKGERATPDEVKIEILSSKIENTEDIKELLRLYHQIVSLRLRLRQYKLGSQDFAKFLYCEQFNILRDQHIEYEIGRRVKIEIEPNNFESICKNTRRNIKWIFEEFNEGGISFLDIREEFYKYINEDQKILNN